MVVEMNSIEQILASTQGIYHEMKLLSMGGGFRRGLPVVCYTDFIQKNFNNNCMAKRRSAVGRRKKTHSRKTAKRLAIKKIMLEAKTKKRKKK